MIDQATVISLAIGAAVAITLGCYAVSQTARRRYRELRGDKDVAHVSMGDAIRWVLTTDVNMYVALGCAVVLIVASITADDWSPPVWLFVVTTSTLLAAMSLVQWTIVMCVELARVADHDLPIDEPFHAMHEPIGEIINELVTEARTLQARGVQLRAEIDAFNPPGAAAAGEVSLGAELKAAMEDELTALTQRLAATEKLIAAWKLLQL